MALAVLETTKEEKGGKEKDGERERERERVGGEKERYRASLVARCISSVDTGNGDKNIDNANNATLHVARQEDRA